MTTQDSALPDSKPCPVCGETIKAAAIRCRFCGEDLAAFERRQDPGQERDLFVGHPAVLWSFGQWVVVVLTLGIALPFYWLRAISSRYRITTQRVQIDRGILSKTRNNVELFRIDDYQLLRPLGMRLVGHAALALKSSDRNSPDLLLRGIPDLDGLSETLRECSLRERERRGIKVWANA